MKETYPRDWKEYKFGDIFDLGGSLSISRANLSDEGICYLHYGDIHKSSDSFIDVDKAYNEIPKYNISLEEVDSKYLLKDGDIVFADASEDYEGIAKSITVVNKDNKPFISGLHTIVARDKNSSIDNSYKRYFLKDWNIRKQLMTLATGTSVLGISQPNLKKIKVFLPAIEEQIKIGGILSEWDKAIELKEMLIEQKKEQKKGLMQKLLTGEVRIAGYRDDWKVVSLGGICSITTGKLDANAMAVNGKYKFFTCAEEVYSIDEYAFDTEALLISGNGANVGYIHYYKGKFNAYQRTYVLSSFSENILFIKYILDQYLKKRIYREKNAGNMPYITLSTLKDMNILIPSIEEQNAICDVLVKMDLEVMTLTDELKQIKVQKKGLMQQLLTGKIRVKA